MSGRKVLLLVSLALGSALSLSAFILSVAGTQSEYPQKFESPMATDERLREPGWWPSKRSAPRDEFIGTAACFRCHRKITESQLTTPMAHAAIQAAGSRILREHSSLSRRLGAYTYSVKSEETNYVYSAADGTNTITMPLAWAFGLGNKGQTYEYQHDGKFFESRMSFYTSLQDLDLTTGHSSDPPQNLEDALGASLPLESLRRCFGCHTTGSDTSEGFDPDRATPGVVCEACHGPGALHATLMDQENMEDGRFAVFNPGRLGPTAMVDFCGACHRTWSDVNEMKVRGVANVRFQPYRLENSRCWGNGDSRLTCVACHDPHKPLVRDASFYDAKCLACHVVGRNAKTTNDHPGKPCPIQKKNCTTCHMPRVVLPSMHSPFVDHRIRIAKPKVPYRD